MPSAEAKNADGAQASAGQTAALNAQPGEASRGGKSSRNADALRVGAVRGSRRMVLAAGVKGRAGSWRRGGLPLEQPGARGTPASPRLHFGSALRGGALQVLSRGARRLRWGLRAEVPEVIWASWSTFPWPPPLLDALDGAAKALPLQKEQPCHLLAKHVVRPP